MAPAPIEGHSHSWPALQRDFEEKRRLTWVGPQRPLTAQHSRAHSAVHSYAVVMLVLRGETKVRHAGDLVLRAGDVHLIPPGDAHGREHSDAECMGLGFYPEALSSDAEERASRLGPLLRVRGGCHPVLRPTPVQRRRLLRWMRLMEEEQTRQERGSDEASLSLLRLVLVELERMAFPDVVPESSSMGLSRRALTYIETHCLEPLSLAKVARELGRSAPHVAAVVRQETGRSVGEWILECRMAEARSRLRHTDERVDIVADRVGYADVTHFIRLFRRVHGVTPAAWRRRMEAGVR